MDVSTTFQAAADHVAFLSGRGDNPIPTGVLLDLYGLYKVATAGPCNVKKPSIFERKGLAKWSAWKRQSGLPADEAMQRYIQVLDAHQPNWRKGDVMSNSSAAAGPVFSCLASASDDDPLLAPLMQAASEDDTTELSRLLESGEAAITDVDEFKCSALHWAADKGSLSAISLLVEAGIDINCRDEDGLTPLQYAALAGENKSYNLLLELGADEQAEGI